MPSARMTPGEAIPAARSVPPVSAISFCAKSRARSEGLLRTALAAWVGSRSEPAAVRRRHHPDGHLGAAEIDAQQPFGHAAARFELERSPSDPLLHSEGEFRVGVPLGAGGRPAPTRALIGRHLAAPCPTPRRRRLSRSRIAASRSGPGEPSRRVRPGHGRRRLPARPPAPGRAPGRADGGGDQSATRRRRRPVTASARPDPVGCPLSTARRPGRAGRHRMGGAERHPVPGQCVGCGGGGGAGGHDLSLVGGRSGSRLAGRPPSRAKNR